MVILAGDFNSTPDSPVMERLGTRWSIIPKERPLVHLSAPRTRIGKSTLSWSDRRQASGSWSTGSWTKPSRQITDPSSWSWKSNELLHLRSHCLHRLFRRGSRCGRRGVPPGKGGGRLLPGGPEPALVAHRNQPHRLQHLHRAVGGAGGAGGRLRTGRSRLRMDVGHHPHHRGSLVSPGLSCESGHDHARIPGAAVQRGGQELVGHLHDSGLHLRGHGHGPLLRRIGPGDHVRAAPRGGE